MTPRPTNPSAAFSWHPPVIFLLHIAHAHPPPHTQVPELSKSRGGGQLPPLTPWPVLGHPSLRAPGSYNPGDLRQPAPRPGLNKLAFSPPTVLFCLSLAFHPGPWHLSRHLRHHQRPFTGSASLLPSSHETLRHRLILLLPVQHCSGIYACAQGRARRSGPRLEEAPWRDGLTRMIGMMCVGKPHAGCSGAGPSQRSRRNHNPSERKPAPQTQASCQVTGAELGPSSGCPDRLQFGLWPEGGTIVTSITHPSSLGAWGSCSIPFLSSTSTPKICPRKSALGTEVLPPPSRCRKRVGPFLHSSESFPPGGLVCEREALGQ